jgi:hypothetical protein
MITFTVSFSFLLSLLGITESKRKKSYDKEREEKEVVVTKRQWENIIYEKIR